MYQITLISLPVNYYTSFINLCANTKSVLSHHLDPLLDPLVRGFQPILLGHLKHRSPLGRIHLRGNTTALAPSKEGWEDVLNTIIINARLHKLHGSGLQYSYQHRARGPSVTSTRFVVIIPNAL